MVQHPAAVRGSQPQEQRKRAHVPAAAAAAPPPGGTHAASRAGGCWPCAPGWRAGPPSCPAPGAPWPPGRRRPAARPARAASPAPAPRARGRGRPGRPAEGASVRAVQRRGNGHGRCTFWKPAASVTVAGPLPASFAPLDGVLPLSGVGWEEQLARARCAEDPLLQLLAPASPGLANMATPANQRSNGGTATGSASRRNTSGWQQRQQRNERQLVSTWATGKRLPLYLPRDGRPDDLPPQRRGSNLRGVRPGDRAGSGPATLIAGASGAFACVSTPMEHGSAGNTHRPHPQLSYSGALLAIPRHSCASSLESPLRVLMAILRLPTPQV